MKLVKISLPYNKKTTFRLVSILYNSHKININIFTFYITISQNMLIISYDNNLFASITLYKNILYYFMQQISP